MKPVFWVDQIPLWSVFILTVILVLGSIWIGTLLGQFSRRKSEQEVEVSLGTIISATLGLLAFMLAFTFGMAADRFHARKQLLLDEVNAISTTYLRASLLLEPHQSQVYKLLSEYVDIRVNMVKDNSEQLEQKIQDGLARSESLQLQMWSHAIALAKADRSSEIDALFISSLNEMIELQTSRVTVFRHHIPGTIWYVLYFITFMSMGMVGYQAGISDKKVLKVGIVLALIFSSVVFLVADLDRATEGYLRVSQKPLYELRRRIQEPTEQEGTADKTELSVNLVDELSGDHHATEGRQ